MRCSLVLLLLLLGALLPCWSGEPPRGAVLVRSLASSALSAWADAGSAGGAAGAIAWDSPLGASLLSLMRALLSPMMHVAAEMTETLLPRGQIVRDARVYAPANLATATFNASGLSVTGLRSIGNLRLTPAGPRRVTVSASFGFVNSSLLIEALLTPLSLAGASVITSGRFMSSLEQFRLDVTFTVPPISRRVALEALSLAPPSPEAEARLGMPDLKRREQTVAEGSDGGVAVVREECEANLSATDDGVPPAISPSSRRKLASEASAMAAPLQLGVEEVVVSIKRVSAAVFKPDEDMTKAPLLCAHPAPCS